MKLQLRDWIISALFASIIAVLAQISIPIPISPVPISGQTLAVGLAATILSTRCSLLAITIYLLMGAIGLPVFSNFKGGLSVIFGVTGGYLISFILVAFLISFYLERTSYRLANAIIINLIAMIITLIIGAIWLKILSSHSWHNALIAGIYPFIPLGIVKGFASAWLGITIRQRLVKLNILKFTKT